MTTAHAGGAVGAPDLGVRLRRALTNGVLMAPATILLVVSVAVPMLLLFWFSLATQVDGSGGPSTKNYTRMLGNSLYPGLLVKSLVFAVIVGTCTAALAWPGAWALSRVNESRRQMLLSLVIIPYLTSLLLLIYAVFVLFGPGGPLMALLDAIGVADSNTSIVYTNWATLLMLVYENLPIMIVVLYSASERVDSNLVAAARSLGAKGFATFTRVIFPMSFGSLMTGFLLVFVPVGGAFVESAILGGPNGQLLGNVIADQLTVANNPPFGASLSVMLLVGIFLVVGFLQVLTLLARWRWGRP